MNSYDLIPDFNNLETLFIMESPHTNEIENQIPCVGETGLRMSRKILVDSNISFGEYLNNNTKNQSFGIMNAFPFPLGLESLLKEDQKVFCSLKELKWINGQTKRKEFYDQHFEKIKDIDYLEKHTHFLKRLTEYSSKSPKLANLIFCGFIAQSVYLQTFKQEIIKYNTLVSKRRKTGKKINLLFVNHPSEKNGEWDFEINTLKYDT